MSKSDRYRSNDPILSTRVFDTSGPRENLRLLRVTLIMACCIVLFACVALIAIFKVEILRRPVPSANMSTEGMGRPS